MKQKKQRVNSWIIVVLVSTFLLSLLFSYISNTAITKLDLIPGIIILVLVILVGVFFDLVGVAVTVANEEHLEILQKFLIFVLM